MVCLRLAFICYKRPLQYNATLSKKLKRTAIKQTLLKLTLHVWRSAFCTVRLAFCALIYIWLKKQHINDPNNTPFSWNNRTTGYYNQWKYRSEEVLDFSFIETYIHVCLLPLLFIFTLIVTNLTHIFSQTEILHIYSKQSLGRRKRFETHNTDGMNSSLKCKDVWNTWKENVGMWQSNLRRNPYTV